jgi:hypothetical protein
MTDSVDPFLFLQQATDSPVNRILLHLLRHPYDLVDARHLMRHLKVSAHDFLTALERLEQKHKDTRGVATPQ